MQYRIKQLTQDKNFMPQRSADGETWHDGVPASAPTVAIAHTYVASMREFDAKDSEGVVVWTSNWSLSPAPAPRPAPHPVMRFEDFLAP